MKRLLALIIVLLVALNAYGQNSFDLKKTFRCNPFSGYKAVLKSWEASGIEYAIYNNVIGGKFAECLNDSMFAFDSIEVEIIRLTVISGEYRISLDVNDSISSIIRDYLHGRANQVFIKYYGDVWYINYYIFDNCVFRFSYFGDYVSIYINKNKKKIFKSYKQLDKIY